MADKIPPQIHIEHGQPPVYFCWKYWMENGEVREGCTPIEPQEDWLDLNDYGWVYIAVPLVLLFIVIFVTSLICRKGGSKSVPKQPLLDDDSDLSEVEVDPMPRNNRAGVVHAVPYRKSTGSDFYSVVKMASRQQTREQPKVPLESAVPYPMEMQQVRHQQAAQPRMYPRLTALKKKSAGSPVRAPSEAHSQNNNYVNNPSAPPKNNGRRNNQQGDPEPTTVLEELDSTSEEEMTDHEEDSEEENHKKG